MTLIDVGASRGVMKEWLIFRQHLRAFCFDPLLEEIDGLQRRVDSCFDIEYHAFFVDCDDAMDPLANVGSNAPASDRLTHDGDYGGIGLFMDAVEMTITEQRTSLDRFFKDRNECVDFIKIDTDGYDLRVLLGAQDVLEHHPVLGLTVEVQFHGSLNEQSNTFANIDRYLRTLGFSLFDMKPVRSSRTCLPSKAHHLFLGESEKGQLIWADATYFRDLSFQDHSGSKHQVTPIKIIKLACLYEMYGLNDCAVELLLQHREELSNFISVDESLDLLAQGWYTEFHTYSEYMARFTSDRSWFIPEIRKLLDRYEASYEDYLQAVQTLRNRYVRFDELEVYRDKRIVFYGAGGRLESMIEQIRPLVEVAGDVYVCDSDPAKQGGRIQGLPIMGPQDLAQLNPHVVIIVSVYLMEIMLSLMRISRNQHLGFNIQVLA